MYTSWTLLHESFSINYAESKERNAGSYSFQK